LQGTGLEDDLSGEGPFTFLAPTDSALYKLNEEDLKVLTEDKHFAARVLRQHLLPGSRSLLQNMLLPYAVVYNNTHTNSYEHFSFLQQPNC
jgi:uncharacterized surface protein with fasciclin (FAS1) repeats